MKKWGVIRYPALGGAGEIILKTDNLLLAKLVAFVWPRKRGFKVTVFRPWS